MCECDSAIQTSLAVAVIALVSLANEDGIEDSVERKRKRGKNREVYGADRRDRHSQYFNWFNEITGNGDTELYLRWTRMRKPQFDQLLSMIADNPLMLKKDTRFKRAITAGERLCLTLRYLAEGSGLDTLATAFRVGKSTCSGIIRDTLQAIVDVLEVKYMKFPSNKDFSEISDCFWNRWNFPHCLGAIDGKHVKIQAPKNSGSEFYNYKNHFSIVLFAICDASYRFTYVDVGSYGSEGDAGIYASSSIGMALSENRLNLPEARPLPNMSPNAHRFPYMFVGDEAFPLKPYLARPYGGRNLSPDQRIYNYRLSRARRIIENAFGILVTKWRVFRQPIVLKPSTVTLAVKAACSLHNFLKTDDVTSGIRSYITPGSIDSGDNDDGSWRADQNELGNFTNIRSGLTSNRSSDDALKLRDYLCKYFSSDKGSVPWQTAHVTRGAF